MKIFRKFLTILTFVVAANFAFAAGKVNINTADAATLATELVGIGSTKAAAIVKYREENGPFKSVESITAVEGIGEKTLESNADRMVIE